MQKSIFFISLILLLAACRKDNTNVFVEEEEFTPAVIKIENPVTASIFGVIEDELGNPIIEAEVYLYGRRTVSSSRGHFVFSNVTMDEAGTFLQVRKEGYFPGSTRFFPADNSENYTKVTLLEETIIGSLESATGGTLTGGEGIQLTFPSNAIIRANGGKYDGTFNVAAQWINPNDSDLYEKMPGSLEGLNADNTPVALASFGMIAVSLTNDTGESLNLGNGQKATLSFPVPASLLDNAPTTIPLWFFDESKGLWQQEGDNAILEGENYIGEVSHFSFWNCDAPYPVVELTGRILDNLNAPVPFLHLNITLESGASAGGFTDNNGYFSGKVPTNVAMELTLNDVLDCLDESVTISPLTDDEDLGDIIVDAPNWVTITGKAINCDGNPITEGLVTLMVDNQNYYSFLNDENDFEISFNNCTNDLFVDIDIVDFDALTFTNPVSFPVNGDTVNTGTTIVCGNSFDDYILFTNQDTTILVSVFTKATYDAQVDTLLIEGHNDNFSPYFSCRLNEVNSVGNYSSDNINIMAILGFGFSRFCAGNGCLIDELAITEFGSIGEKIEGHIVGEIEENTGTLKEYQIQFRITRE